MKKILSLPIFLAVFAVFSCSGEDRRGEVPLVPTVRISSAIVDSGCVNLQGEVLASPNSSLVYCGFSVGNDTLKRDVRCSEPAFSFSATADSLESGRYYAVAYAKNGMGLSESDTLWFSVE